MKMNIVDLKLPPHNIEAEMGTLSCVLLDNNSLSILDDVGITSESFYKKEHKIIMFNIEALRFAGRSIDVVTLCDALGDELDIVGGQEYVLTLSVYSLTTSICREYCEIVKDKQLRRDVIDLTSKINSSCYGEKDIKKIISRSILRLGELNNDNQKTTDLGVRFYEKSDLISWGNSCVDNIFGYACNDLVILYATAGTGKTEFMCHIANKNGREGKKVVYYALENSPQSLKQRSSYSRVGLSKAQFQRGEYNEYQKKKIIENYQNFDKFFELTSHSKDMFKMLVEIEKKAKEGYDVIIIDNLGKITRDGHDEMQVQDRFTSECQEIKNKYQNINIFIVHHEAKRPMKNAPGKMRGNQKIEDNSTIMIQLWRSLDPDDMEEERSLLNIEQTKDTEGGVIARAGVYYHNGNYYDTYGERNK